MKFPLLAPAALALTLAFSLQPSALVWAAPLGTAFTYQGRLNNGGAPADGNYDLWFKLYDDATSGTQIGSTVAPPTQAVSNGLFTVALDFGADAFTGGARWLEIGVRTSGGKDPFSVLAPRQPLTAAPHALFARSAPAGSLTGTVPDLNLPTDLARTNHGHYGQDWSGGGTSGLRVFNTKDGPNVGLLGAALGADSRGVQGQNSSSGVGVQGQSVDGTGVLGQSSTGYFFLGTVRAKGGFLGGGAGLSNVTAMPLAPSAMRGLWGLGGNLDTSYDSFLGTANLMPLELRVNNQRGFRLEYASTTFSLFRDEGVHVYGGYWNNLISAGVVAATISGGGFSHFDPIGGTVSHPNQVTGNFGTVAGGYDNAAGTSGNVSGGHHNTANQSGVVGGGYQNLAGIEGTVPGGIYNEATGPGSFAAGRYAHATHEGSFVWGDGLYDQYSSRDLSFDIAARGGARFYIGDEGFWIANNKGIGLDAQDAPLITRGWDAFTSAAGSKAGLGRWGLFMEPGQLVAGIPAEDVGARTFAVGKYAVDGTYQALITVRQDGNLTCNSLSILGGADLAEPFAMSEQNVAAGSVVVIDEQNPGRLKLSHAAYDHKVAGVVSGANGIKAGISMVQEHALEAGRNVALSGRVYVLADARYGAIEPGDLLTTSDTPGHARKVTDHAKAQGAILGKAMSVLREGQGQVLILVTLQ
ncbi:MAG: hypothetical protein NTW03_03820 [Verrucomicrobia bacterium]|nr:hypothetical protein [Verrucomicrobiota bacterium]